MFACYYFKKDNGQRRRLRLTTVNRQQTTDLPSGVLTVDRCLLTVDRCQAQPPPLTKSKDFHTLPTKS